jgi:hypothetical protein
LNISIISFKFSGRAFKALTWIIFDIFPKKYIQVKQPQKRSTPFFIAMPAAEWQAGPTRHKNYDGQKNLYEKYRPDNGRFKSGREPFPGRHAR